MNIQGTIHSIAEVQQVTATFSKREFVLETAENPMYPQYLLFQMVQDRTGLIDGYRVGQQIDVAFNLRGRQWTSPQGEVKTFNTLEAWKIGPVAGADTNPAQKPVQQAATVGAGAPINNGAVDDSPF